MSYTTEGHICPSERLADCLRRVRASSKEIARRIGCSPDSVKNWRSRGNTMSADKLIALMAHYDEVYAEVMQMAGRASQRMTAEQILDELTRKLRDS